MGGLNLQFLEGCSYFLKITLSFLQTSPTSNQPEPTQKSKHMKSLEKGASFPLECERQTDEKDRLTPRDRAGVSGVGEGLGVHGDGAYCMCVRQ